MPQNKKAQSGNVFIIILVAIALFGALMFTFSRSGSQGISSISKQEAKIAAQEIISFFNLLDVAYNKLRMKGCSESDISFANNGDTGIFINANDSPTAPIDKSCHIFDDNGGKISINMDWTKYQKEYSEFTVAQQNEYGQIHFKSTNSSTVGIGTVANDIMLHLNYVSSDICYSYNDILGNGVDTSIPDDGPVNGEENTTLAGKENFCRFGPSGNAQIRKIWIAK